MSKYTNGNIRYSQNFLTSRRTISRLVALSGLGRQDDVVEIGAGKGHITRALADACRTVQAVELDRKLYEGLQEAPFINVRLIHGDFLAWPLPKTPYKVFSNIPFSITTDIVRKLSRAPNPPLDAWLIMEMGAAKRFCGQPQESIQSLLLKPYFDLRIAQRIDRREFHPMPKVDAALLHLHKRETPDLLSGEMGDFERFIRHSLPYGFFGNRAMLTKKQVATALRLAGLPQIGRSDTLLYVQWLCLFRCWLQFGAHGRS